MYEDATTPVATLHVDPDRPVIVIIGPEGGIAPDELELFEGVGAVTLSMGPTILRTSTAGAVAVTQVRLLAEVGR
jgi:16S rRNA (uracil1498-N3)-methyltransferase